MVTLQYILRKLSAYLIEPCPAMGEHICPEHVELLGSQELLLASRLYLGTADSAPLLARVSAEKGALVLLAGSGRDPDPGCCPEGCVLVRLFCSLTLLFNTMSQAVADVRRWRASYDALADQGQGLHAIISLTAQLTQSTALLLDQSGRVVAGSGMDRSPYLTAQLSTAGALPHRTMEAIFPPVSAAQYGSWSVPGTNLTLHAQRMFYEERLVGTLVVAEQRGRPELDFRALCHCATNCLRSRLLSHDPARLGSSTKLFQRCWEDIVQRKLVNNDDIRSALSRMPHPIRQFAQVAVVTFSSGGGVPYNYLIARLREFFPDINMAVHKQDIVLLFSYEERTFPREIPCAEQLEELLCRFDACFAMGNGTRNLTALAFQYALTKQAAMLARQLEPNSRRRVFFYEEYSMYCAIDLCAQRFLEVQGSDDIIYLIHPAVIHLTRYDRTHNSNLRDVLYYYLLNDRNLMKTATCTYIHRNTVINKVNKILELVDLDLEDGGLRQRLMFSCQVINYYEKIMKLELKL